MRAFGRSCLFLPLLAIAACSPYEDEVELPLLERLRALPHVVSVEEGTTDLPEHRFFVIGFEQPVDHGQLDGPTFVQKLTLMHRDEAAPLVLFNTGYMLPDFPIRGELAYYFEANQLSVEHRFFGSSVPAGSDWSDLTVKQSADDFHAIRESFKDIYGGAWLSTGVSKGGKTAIYHRRFYPDDVDATVAYVAPHHLGPNDLRHDVFLDEVVPQDCMQKVRDLQVEALQNRRAYLETRASERARAEGLTFGQVNLPAAVEAGVGGAEFEFWQYAGVDHCAAIPAVGASDEDIAAFFEEWGDPLDSADAYRIAFAPYYYQLLTELGYPGGSEPHLEGLYLHADDEFGSPFPAGLQIPPFHGDTMLDVGEWVRSEAEHIVFIYGEFDPWTAAPFDTGSNPDVATFNAYDGNHGANLHELIPADRGDALLLLEEWTGAQVNLDGEKPRRLDLAPRKTPPAHLLRAIR